jgi:PPP family 3-phenylpropionic acid transporter
MVPSIKPRDASLSDFSVATRLSLFYIFVFINAGLYLPDWPVWLTSRGLGPVEISLLFSAGRFARVVSSPLIARIADRRGDRRTPLLLLSGITAAAFLVYAACTAFWQYFLVAVVVGIAWGTIIPLGDSLALENTKQRSIQYGRVRLWGSISFILATLAGGKALELLPDSSIFWILLASFVGVLAVCLWLPDTRVEGATIRLSAIWRLFAHPTFALLMLASALLQSSHLVVYIFGTLHWRHAGIGESMIGFLWAVGVVAEVVLFAIGARLTAALRPGWLFVLAAVAGIIRWPLLAHATTLPVLIVAQTLHGVTFGAAHLAAMAFIAEAIPSRLSATAQSLHGAVALSTASAVIAPFLGRLFDAYGGGAFHAMTGLSLGGGLAALLLMRRWRGGLLMD